MPGPPDDDAPRWEPTWESPGRGAPSQWDPDTDVPRWDPAAETPRWTPPVETAPGARFEAPAPRPAPIPPGVAGGPLAWWRSHPWIPVWALVLGLPLLGVALRLLDESGHEGFVAPLAWTYGALGVAALAMAALARAGRSPLRLALGVAGALVASVVVLWPVTQITLGRTSCPARAGPDLGVPIAAAALEAWRQGKTGEGGWRGGLADTAWTERARRFGVVEYSLVESGCWERVAPVDGGRTWHEFRVTVQAGEDRPLSKVVVVHTVRDDDRGWKITAIEGPLP
jgi:hypothetical protein